MYSAGIGALHLSEAGPTGWTPERRDWFLEFMLRH
jgi:hypothetical protein